MPGSKQGIRIRAIGLLLTLFGSGTSFAQVTSGAFDLMLQHLLDHSVKEISVRRAKTSPEVFWLDTRSRNEYNVSHIKNAIWVGYRDFDITALKDIPTDARIIVYCSVGWRSEKIAMQLVNAGFQRVVNLYGGVFEWVNQGLPVYKEGVKTDEVHGYSPIWGMWLNKGTKVYSDETDIK